MGINSRLLESKMSYEFKTRRHMEEAVLFEKIKARDIPNCKWLEGVNMKNYIKENAFKAIFTLGLLIGLPVTPSILNGNQRDIGHCAKLWCFILATIKTIMMLFTLAYLHQILPTWSLRFTFYIYEMCGYISMILIFKKRKKLYAAILNLCHLSKILSPDSFIGGKRIKLHIVLFVFSIALLNVCLFLFFFQQESSYFHQAIYIPPFIPKESRDSYINFILLSTITSFGISVTTCGFVFILSCNLYEVLEKQIQFYEQNLKERMHRISWNMAAISDDISVFKNITFRVHEVDDAVNMCVFFLYGGMMSGFFNTLSVLIVEDPTYKTPIVICYVIWVFSSASVSFLILSNYGTHIIDQGEKVKRRMIEYSDKFIRTSPPMHALEVFSFLFDIIMKSNMIVTGGGMFVINYGLILTIAGTMITYGVLILQLDNNSSTKTNQTGY